MKARKRIFILMNAVLIFFWLGCSGTVSSISAPPVDMPAPITGRVDVSSPDASGMVTVKGTAGAVPAGSLVMAVNEGVSSAKMLRIMNFFVSDAYAQDASFPAICNETGHACALADVDGSFVILL